MDNKPEKGFSYWFVNVFLYHYGKLSIALLVALIVVVTLILGMTHKKQYDFNMAICSATGIPYESIGELTQLVSDTVGDLNNDGIVRVNVEIVDNPVIRDIRMASDEYVVFLMDDSFSSIFKDDFNDLSNYGITPDKNISSRVYIGDTPLMKRLNLNIKFYACLADWTTDGKGKPAWTEAGVKVINAILNSK